MVEPVRLACPEVGSSSDWWAGRGQEALWSGPFQGWVLLRCGMSLGDQSAAGLWMLLVTICSCKLV